MINCRNVSPWKCGNRTGVGEPGIGDTEHPGILQISPRFTLKLWHLKVHRNENNCGVKSTSVNKTKVNFEWIVAQVRLK